MRFVRSIVLAVTPLIALALLTGCGGRRLETVMTGATMGTTYSIKYVAPTESGRTPDAATISKEIEARLDEINGLMSTYRTDSEISRFNAFQETTPFKVSKKLMDVLEMAQGVSKMTDGAFDITVGPLVNAYGFGAGEKSDHLLTRAEVDELLKRVGYRLLELDPEALTIRKKRPDIYVDLAAIAKGYGVDEVSDILEANGVTDYMVEIGGEVRAKGRNAQGLTWQIGVEKPVEDKREIQRVIPLSGEAVATSGDYRNFYMSESRRVSHMINPKTGRPVSSNLGSVAVVHDRCAMADALATAFMVMPPKEAFEVAEKEEIAALFLFREPDNTIFEKTTFAFRQHMNDH